MGKKNRKQNNKKKKHSSTTTSSNNNNENNENHVPDTTATTPSEAEAVVAVSSEENNIEDVDGLDAIIFPGDEVQLAQPNTEDKVETAAAAAAATSTVHVIDLDTMKTATSATTGNLRSDEAIEPLADKVESSSMEIEVNEAPPVDATMIQNENSNNDFKSPSQQEGGEGNESGGQTTTGPSSAPTDEEKESNLTTTTTTKRSSSKSPTGSAQPENKTVQQQKDRQENSNDLDLNQPKNSYDDDEKKMDLVDQAAKKAVSDDMDDDGEAATATEEKEMSLGENESPPSQVSEGIDPDQNDNNNDTNNDSQTNNNNNNNNKNRILAPPRPSLIEQVNSVLSTGSNDNEANLSMEPIDEQQQQQQQAASVDMDDEAVTNENEKSSADPKTENPPSVSEGIDPSQNDNSDDSENDNNKKRLISPPRPSLIEKVNSVLSTDGNEEPNLSMGPIDEQEQLSSEMMTATTPSVTAAKANDSGIHPKDDDTEDKNEVPQKQDIVSNEINFTADGAGIDGVVIPKPGSFVGANNNNDNNSTTKVEKEDLEIDLSNFQSSWVLKQGSSVSTDSPAAPEVHQDINFKPSGSDDMQSSSEFIPKPGSYVARTPSSVIGNDKEGKNCDDDAAILPLGDNARKEGEQRTSLVVEKEINFSPGGSDLAAAPPPQQGSFVGGPMTDQDRFENLVRDHQMSHPESPSRSFVVSQEINFSPGGSDLVTAPPPKQGSFVGDTTLSQDRVEDSVIDAGVNLNSLMKNDEIEGQIMPASINRTPSREINFCPGGSDISSAAPPKQGSFVGGESLVAVRDVSIPDEPDTALKTAAVETTITGPDAYIGQASDKEINFCPDGTKTQLEPASASPPPKQGSFVGAVPDHLCEHSAKANESIPGNVAESGNTGAADEAVFIGDIYECGKGDQHEEEAKSKIPITAVTDEESDDDDGDLRAEDQLQWKAEKLQKPDESGELAGIIETSDEENSEDADKAAKNNETNKAETIDKESFHPNESILAMEAMIESALNDDVFSPDGPSAEKIVETERKVVEGQEDVDMAGDDTMPAVGGPAAVDKSAMETEDMLESALSDSLGVPEPKVSEAPAHDLAVVASGTEDTEDYVPDASIAEMEAAIARALDADDIALDDLMQDSPIKSSEAEKNRTVDEVLLDDLMQDSPIKLPDSEKKRTVAVTDEANEALSALLDGTQYEELETEITFDETPSLESKAMSGGIGAGLSTAKKSASAGSRNEKRDSAPRATQNAATKTGMSRKTGTKPAQSSRQPTDRRSLAATKPRVADRSTAKPADRSTQPTKKVQSRRPFLSGNLSSKSNASEQRKGTRSVTKPPERSRQPQKKPPVPRRSFLSGTFSSKTKTSKGHEATSTAKPAEGKKQPPKKPPVPRRAFLAGTVSSKASTGNDEKGGRKKGSARRLVSAVTSWAKKGEPTKSKPSSEHEEPHVASTNARQERSRPTPVQLFGDDEPDRTIIEDTQDRPDIYVEVPAGTLEKAESSNTEARKNITASQTPTSANRPFPASPWQSSIRSVASLSSQCSVVSFTSPRKVGRFGCQGKFQPFLHESRGPCELCVFLLSDDDKALLDLQGRHLQVMTTSGGCNKSCELFPREDDEPPVRLCRKCFHNSHRQMYRKVIPKRNLLRRMGEF